jgi:glucose-6-phosphate dehydrogenase assembly protein OpcA
MVTRSFNETEFDENLSVAVEGQNLIKASLFNLIVIANSLQRALHGKELAKLVTERFPCRVIFVQSDEANQSDFFHTERSLQAIGSGANRVCFDQFVIESSVNQLQKVPFLILPNIMPDLPVYILLGHDPTLDRVILPQLQKYASRIIFDCETIDNPQRFSERVLALMHDSCIDFIDVNWSRTKAWREVMARVFNDKEKIESLRQSKLISISFAGQAIQHQPKNEIQALYFQAWLAAQLGWSLMGVEKEDGTLRISYNSHDLTTTVTLAPKDTEALEAGAIFSVEVLTHNDCHYLISHERESQHVVVHASNPERCEMPFTLYLSNYQKGTALVNEILYQPLSEHYVQMLHALSNPKWEQSL